MKMFIHYNEPKFDATLTGQGSAYAAEGDHGLTKNGIGFQWQWLGYCAENYLFLLFSSGSEAEGK